jgi:hypothetical protein
LGKEKLVISLPAMVPVNTVAWARTDGCGAFQR